MDQVQGSKCSLLIYKFQMILNKILIILVPPSVGFVIGVSLNSAFFSYTL